MLKGNQDEQVVAYAQSLVKQLSQARVFDEPVRAKLDMRLKNSVDKTWEWVRKGAPIVIEVGPRDLEKQVVMVRTRIKFGTEQAKEIVPCTEFVNSVATRLTDIQDAMYAKAQAFMDHNIRTDITTPEQMRAYFANKNVWLGSTEPHVAFVRGKWNGKPETEELLKEMKISIRAIPFDQTNTEGVCLLSGEKATIDVIYARSY